MKYLLAGLLLGAVSFGAQAQQVIPTTPDISIGNTATVDVAWSGRATFIHLQNHCSDAIYFDLNGARDAGSRNFGLRLPSASSPNSAFSGSFDLAGSIEASASSGASGTCTFSVLLGR